MHAYVESLYKSRYGRIAAATAVLCVVLVVGITLTLELLEANRQDEHRSDVRRDGEVVAAALREDAAYRNLIMGTAATIGHVFDLLKSTDTCTDDYCIVQQYTQWIANAVIYLSGYAIADETMTMKASASRSDGTVGDAQKEQFAASLGAGTVFPARMPAEFAFMTNPDNAGLVVMRQVDAHTYWSCGMAPIFKTSCARFPFPGQGGCTATREGEREGMMVQAAQALFATAADRQSGRAPQFETTPEMEELLDMVAAPLGEAEYAAWRERQRAREAGRQAPVVFGPWCTERTSDYLAFGELLQPLYDEQDRHYRFFAVNAHMGASVDNADDHILLSESKPGTLNDPVRLLVMSSGVEWYLDVERTELAPNSGTIVLIVVVILAAIAASGWTYWSLLTLDAHESLSHRNRTLDELLGVLTYRAQRSEVVSHIGFVVSDRDTDKTVLETIEEVCESTVTVLPSSAAVVVIAGHEPTQEAMVATRRNRECSANVTHVLSNSTEVRTLLNTLELRNNNDDSRTTSFMSLTAHLSQFSASVSEISDEQLRQVVSAGQSVGTRIQIAETTEGGEHTVVAAEVIATPIQGSSGTWGYVLVLAKTELVEADLMFLNEIGVFLSHMVGYAEREKNKRDFLAMMSHEMYTPLHGIFGSVELLNDSDPKLSEPQADLTHSIHDATDRMLKLVGSMLTYAELGDGNVRLDTVWVDPVDVADHVCQILAGEATKKGLDIAAINTTPVPISKLDSHRVHQVLLQMTQNSIKFTDKGSVMIEVSATLMGVITFTVRDTGRGISEERKSSLFDLFTQEDTSITREYGGTGMGLAVCKEVVELMGGSIEVQSELGKGTAFSFTVSSEVPPSDDHEGVENAKVIAAKPLTVAVVGLPALYNNVAQNMLARLGHRPVSCDTAADVLDRNAQLVLAHDSKAAIVKDLSVPYMFVHTGGTRMVGGLSLPTRVADLQDAIGNSFGMSVFSSPAASAPSTPTAADVEAAAIKAANDAEIAGLAAGAKSAAPSDKRRMGSVRALACEDDPLNRRLLRLFCRKLKCDVVFAEDGQCGVEAFRDNNGAPFDIVWMDLHMPRKNGFDAAREIRAMDAAVPIVALTADHTAGVQSQCIAAGMQAMINKPFQKDDLSEAIWKYVK